MHQLSAILAYHQRKRFRKLTEHRVRIWKDWGRVFEVATRTRSAFQLGAALLPAITALAGWLALRMDQL